jgi:hypothetical protein
MFLESDFEWKSEYCKGKLRKEEVFCFSCFREGIPSRLDFPQNAPFFDFLTPTFATFILYAPNRQTCPFPCNLSNLAARPPALTFLRKIAI